MTEVYRATFSNGTVMESRKVRRVYTHAWHAKGYHRLSNKPWQFGAFSSSRWRAEERMKRETEFLRPDRISFEEVVEAELIWVGEKRERKPWRHPSVRIDRQ